MRRKHNKNRYLHAAALAEQACQILMPLLRKHVYHLTSLRHPGWMTGQFRRVNYSAVRVGSILSKAAYSRSRTDHGYDFMRICVDITRYYRRGQLRICRRLLRQRYFKRTPRYGVRRQQQVITVAYNVVYLVIVCRATLFVGKNSYSRLALC